MRELKTASLLSLLFFLSACASDTTKISVLSADSLWHLSASGSPQFLTIYAADKDDISRQYAVKERNGTPARITCLFEAPSRASFLAVLPSAGEIWEMSYDANAAPVFPGFVHNYRTGQVEGITVEEQPFARRRLRLAMDHTILVFSPSYTEVIGRGEKGGIIVYNLDSRKLAGKLTDQAEVSLLDSLFAVLDDKPVFVLNFPDGKQRTFSTRTWREMDGKTLKTSKFIPVNICGK